MTDVIVVGAGPAGSVTALCLARAGHDVLLLDRRRFPRAKPCGDCLSPGATPILQRLGLLATIEALGPARLAGWRFESVARRAWAARFDGAPAAGEAAESVPAALAVDRTRFDAALLEAARLAGVRVATGVHVTGVSNGTDAHGIEVLARSAGGGAVRRRARLLVGADGLRSVVARRTGLRNGAGRLRKVSLTAHVAVPAPAGPYGELYFGAGWVVGFAPIGAGEPGAAKEPANLTLVAEAGRFGAALRGDPGAFFRERVLAVPRLRDRLAPLPGGWPGPLLASGPFDMPARGVVGDRVALVGDAAGYYDPLTGQGIHQALAGAEVLAEEADAALRRDDLRRRGLRGYARRHRRLCGPTRAVQRVLETITSRPALTDFAFGRLDAAPAAARELVRVTGDLRPARALLSAAAVFSFLGAVLALDRRSDDHDR